jgi:Mannosyltransferase (PIG-V)
MAVQEHGVSTGEPADPPATPRHAAPQTTQSWRARWSEISLPFWIVTSRIGLGLIFAHLVIVLLPQSRQHFPGGALSNGTWLGAFYRWDATYYVTIAQHGYSVHAASQTAFFPGYPLVVALVHGVTLGALSYYQSAMAVSWLAFTAGAVLLYRLTERLYGPRVALVTVALFCWFPASLFFMSPYSEALFALEIIVVLALIERRQFLGASLVAAFASATSPESIALTLALVIAAVLAGTVWHRVIFYAAISGVGIFAYMLFLWARFSSPTEFITVQRYWGRSEHFPFVGLYRNVLALRHYLVGPGPPLGGTSPTFTNIRWVWLLDDGALVLGCILAVALGIMCVTRWQSRGEPGIALGLETGPVPVSFVVVALVIVGLAACTTISPYALPTYASSEGEARFVSVAAPLYVSGALVIRRSIGLICFVIGGSVILALIFQAMYNLGYWLT